MEDILVLILQGIVQIALEILAYLPWDLFWYADAADPSDRNPWSQFSVQVVAAIFSLITGALVGWCSLHFFPDTVVRWGWLRIVLLVASPLASGVIARRVALWRKESNSFVDPTLHFWVSLCFSVGLVWIRFVFAHRPA